MSRATIAASLARVFPVGLATAAMCLLATSAQAGCPSTPDSLFEHVKAAEQAFGALDAGGFEAAMAEVNVEVACIESVVPPGMVAQLHMVIGLGGFLARDIESAKQSFRAARSADPALALDTSYAPEGGPLHQAWTAALEMGPSPTVAMPASMWVDGTRSEMRPTEAPTLLQRASDDVFDGALLAPSDPLPAWALVPDDDPVLPSTTVEPMAHGAGSSTSSTRTLQLASASGSALLLSGGLLTAALIQEGRFNRDDALTYEERVDLQKRTNNLGFAAQGFGLVGLGLGAGAVISTRW